MTASFWDGVARKYAAAKIGNPQAYESWLARVAARLSVRDEVLEVGCGTGTTALRLAANVKHMKASDYSSEMIAIAKEKLVAGNHDNVTFVRADPFDPALELEGEKGAGYDVVMGFNFLHLVDDPSAMVNRLAGLARPGGLVITKTACLKYRSLYLLPIVGLMRLLGKAPPVRSLSISEVDEMMLDVGLNILEQRTFGGVVRSRFLIARKG